MLKKTASSIYYIFKTILKHDKLLLIIILVNNLFVMLSILSPIIFPQYIIDSLVNNEDFQTTSKYIFIFSITAISSSCISYLLKSSIYLRSMTMRFRMIIEYGKKYISMDYENFENPEILDLADRGSRATQNNASGFEGIVHKFANFGGNILTAVTLFSILSFLSPIIIIAIVILLIVNSFIERKLNKYEKRTMDELVNVERKYNYILKFLNDVGYYKDVIMFNMKDMIFKKIFFLRNIKLSSAKSIQNRHEISNNIISLLSSIQKLIVYLWIGNIAIKGQITIGQYTMYVASVASFYNTIKSIISDFLYIVLQGESIEDYRKYVKLATTSDDANCVELTDNVETIKMENVYFRYIGQNDYALKDINLLIKKKEKIAIVGLNGAGKTTFIKLLTKLYEPTNGTIYFNGIDSKKINKGSLYDAFSVVFQESNLFAFTVAENISMVPLKNTNVKEISSVLEKVGLKDVINNLPKKIEHPVLKIIDENGINFSGGEIQKLSLARALYKNGQIMILDEPTASYDALSEERIYRQFNDLTQDKTVIYISHRLASTRFCDRILVFEDGRIVEEGSHDDLLLKNGRYAELFHTQAQQYREEDHK